VNLTIAIHLAAGVRAGKLCEEQGRGQRRNYWILNVLHWLGLWGSLGWDLDGTGADCAEAAGAAGVAECSGPVVSHWWGQFIGCWLGCQSSELMWRLLIVPESQGHFGFEDCLRCRFMSRLL
jgi:hypothetical protein